MTKGVLSKYLVLKNREKLKKAFNIAIADNYDVSSICDVVKILKRVDPDYANEEYAVTFSKMLQLFSKIKKKIARKQKMN